MSGDPDPISIVDDEEAHRRILSNIKSIEEFVFFRESDVDSPTDLYSDEYNKKIRKSRYLSAPSRKKLLRLRNALSSPDDDSSLVEQPRLANN